MLWDEADQFDDGLGTGVEGAELEHSYLPSQLVLEPLPKILTQTLCKLLECINRTIRDFEVTLEIILCYIKSTNKSTI